MHLPPLVDAATARGEAVYPSGEVELSLGEVMAQQEYDVQIELLVPLSPMNRDLGNFMVDVEMYSAENKVLLKARRPAIIPYRSGLPGFLATVLRAPLVLVRLMSESEWLVVRVAERWVFQSAARAPEGLRVTLGARRIQTYMVRVRFRARLSGLRNFMYSYRLVAAGLFVSVFWVIEVVCAVGVWWMLVGSGRSGGSGVVEVVKIKKEESEEGVEDEDDEETPGEAERVQAAVGQSTPGRNPAGRERDRGYLPSPSQTPQPQGQPAQGFTLPELVREGYADGGETDTDASVSDGVEVGGAARGGARRGAMVEDDEVEAETEGSEEGAVLVSGGGGAQAADSGVGTTLYESTSATGREGRRGSSGSASGVRRR